MPVTCESSFSSQQNQVHRTMTLSPHLSAITLPSVSDNDVQSPCKHVLFFGETGVGKSSVIKMLIGEDTDTPRVSSKAIGCTSTSVPYLTTIGGQDFALWDTIGLNESEQGSTHPLVAAHGLAKLVRGLKDDLNLLVYVIRGTRFREVVRLNYDLFYRDIFDEQVPIVVVVTGLENEEPMEAWWNANGADLQRVGLVFQDHACVTACRGPLKFGRQAYEEEYEESKEKLRALVVKNCSPALGVGRHRERRNDPGETIGGLTNTRGRSRRSDGQGQHEHDSVCGDTFFWCKLCQWFSAKVRALNENLDLILGEVV